MCSIDVARLVFRNGIIVAWDGGRDGSIDGTTKWVWLNLGYNTSNLLINHTLVGGFNPSEKYWSVGMIIPTIYIYYNIHMYIYMEKYKMFQTTNQ